MSIYAKPVDKGAAAKGHKGIPFTGLGFDVRGMLRDPHRRAAVRPAGQARPEGRQPAPQAG